MYRYKYRYTYKYRYKYKHKCGYSYKCSYTFLLLQFSCHLCCCCLRMHLGGELAAEGRPRRGRPSAQGSGLILS